jgi:hypothetical protein
MIIETTLYLHRSILEMLDRESAITGRSRTSIIKLLMKMVMRENKNMIQSYSRIKYQGGDVKENWHRLHIVINEYEYEYYLDMRKLYKMSVSFILAFAMMRYLDNIVHELLCGNINTDNYRYNSYILMKRIIDGVICWQLYWGIPTKIPFN